MEITFTIPPEEILRIKKEVVEKIIQEFNDQTGSLKELSYIEKDGDIYIMQGVSTVIVI
ncbi:hypothetical protein PO081_17010 [Bacteroides thetaiotaomicron]|jgi:hypothetical protein|uniref:hypothetical protein n=1 Tax=Bacteroides thetaiotaomicron TaxID=818 RepID=UPI00232C28CA|nr:hypothetical protein [Bacteroides thetaiotaomicron]MDC2194983.1 hypothetical protein [Bacteroides thetaiotaomicron]